MSLNRRDEFESNFFEGPRKTECKIAENIQRNKFLTHANRTRTRTGHKICRSNSMYSKKVDTAISRDVVFDYTLVADTVDLFSADLH